MDKKNDVRPILTISLLISNRPETVRKCLESLTPLRQAIPCELLITDTSKSSEIREIIEEYADRIFEFEWCNDFSKARNLGLNKANGEWFMYMDDDEWFDDLSEMIEFFRSGEYKDYGYANYKTRDYIDPGLNYYSDTWASRMIRIDPDTHFKSKIHEHFEPVRGKLKSLNCHTHHVGYIYKSHEDLMKHFHRNEPLLREMMEEEPDNLRWQIQLVQEYRNIKEWNKVCDFCETQLKANEMVNNKYDNIHLGTFYAGYAEALTFQKNYEKCIAICKSGLSDKRSTAVTKAYLHLKLIESYFWMRDIENTKKYLEIYFRESEELPKYKDAWVEQNVALLVNEVFDETNTKKAYSILIGCDLLEGGTQMLHKYYGNLEWKREVIYVYDNIEKVFLEAMTKLPYETIFSEVMTDMLRNVEFKNLVIMEANRWEIENPEVYHNLVRVFENTESKDWYVWYAKAHLTALNDLWKQIPVEKWKQDVSDFLNSASQNQVEFIVNKMSDCQMQDDWRYGYFEFYLAKYGDDLNLYIDKVLDFYGRYYVEDAFMHYPEVLPGVVQDAIKSLRDNSQIEDARNTQENINIQDMLLSEWITYVDEHFANGIIALENLRSQVEQCFSSNDLRYCYFMKAYYNQLIRLESNSESFEQLYKRFFDFMEYTLGYYLCIFRDEAFQGEMEMLPVDAKAAVVLHRMFSREENDWVNKVRDLRECATIYPILGNNIKRLASMIAKLD